LGKNISIPLDVFFLLYEMTLIQSDDKVYKKIYRNTNKILQENSSDTTLTTNVIGKIHTDTIHTFQEKKTTSLKSLKTDLTRV
jgi:hypothetical protein